MPDFNERRPEIPPEVGVPGAGPVVGARPQVSPQPSAQGSALPVSADAQAARTEVSAPFADPALARPGTADAAAEISPELKRRMEERERYLAQMRAGDIARADFAGDQFAGSEEARDVVRLRGTDSTPNAGRGGEGHIMGTEMVAGADGSAAAGQHFSFYPAHPDVRKRREWADEGSTSSVKIGAGEPPFETAGPIGISAMPGGLAPEESDHYLYQTRRTESGAMERVPGTDPKKQDFDHAFDPEFLDPKRFAAAVRQAKARSGELEQSGSGDNLAAREMELAGLPADALPPEMGDPARRQARDELKRENEFRLASVPTDREMDIDDKGKPTSMGRFPGQNDSSGKEIYPPFSETDPRVENFEPPEGGEPEPTVQAQNCGTELMKVFRSMGMLNSDDMVMLGADKNGNFKPGFDLTPQQLYEHMRWREHEFKLQREQERLKAQNAAAPEHAP